MEQTANKLVLIHTIPSLIAVFDQLASELLPDVTRMHILDEPLLERVRQRGSLADDDSQRLKSHVDAARQVGAGAALVTCSSISPCVDDIFAGSSIPVVKIDEAMIAEAVATGTRIGVVATNPTTLKPTCQSLQAQARLAGKAIQPEPVLVERALPSLLNGDGATHDRLVRAAVLELAERSDVVVLAQATMARVLEVISEADRRVPILSSPHLALLQLKQHFATNV